MSNKQCILYGPPCCGKTAFLKNYAMNNRSSIFYVDVNESSKSPNEYETILKTLRPDYKFWKNDPEDIAKDTPIPNELLTAYINPWGTYSEISSQILKEVISTDDTLILDNITSTEQLKYYSDFLPCHIIFVTNQPHLYSEIPTYDFCSHNKNNLDKILKGMINHNLAFKIKTKSDLKNMNIETLAPKIEAGLCSNLGTDLYVYRLVALNYVELILPSGTDNANDFLHQIVSSREIEPFNRSINPYAKHKLSMQAKSGESTSRYIRNFIRWIYKTNLTDIQQKILHFLYRCQVISDGKISVQDLYPYLGSNISVLTKKLIDLGWITEDSFKIPLIIASSLNDIKNFTNQEYSEFLNMMGHFFVILRGFTSIPINKEICMLLIHAIHEDFQSYIKPRGEKPSNEVQKNFYNNLNKMDPEGRSKFRETGISSEYYQHDENDPIGNSQFMYWLIVNEFYCSAILFTLQYGFIDEAKDLLQFASNVENISYFTDNNINNLIWKLRITILADSSVVNNSISHLGLLDDAFQQYVNYQPKNKNGIGRRHYDDKPVLITMYLQSLLDFQYAALALWKDTRSYLNSDPERINMAARACIVPFCSLKMYKLKYNLIYPEGKDGLLEYRILNQIFNLFDKISKALSGSPEFLFPAWIIDDSLSDKVSSYKIYSQYHILFQIMQIYYSAFINKDTVSVPELQKGLQTLLEDNQDNQLPTFIDEMAGYALSLT